MVVKIAKIIAPTPYNLPYEACSSVAPSSVYWRNMFALIAVIPINPI
jgi:hypothetical protein